MSFKDNDMYVGYAIDLQNRLKQHKEGKVKSTKDRRPIELIYYEACLSEKDAKYREKYLKSSYGRRFLNKRLKQYLTEEKTFPS